MENFISPVYIKPNPVSEEKICVGLFIGSGESTFFSLSDAKLRVLNNLLPREVYHSVTKSLRTLEVNILNKSKMGTENAEALASIFTADYFNYLNKYNKGLLCFSEPAVISKRITETDYEKLFIAYVGDALKSKEPVEPKKTIKKIMSGYLARPAFRKKADINFKINNSIASGIYTERTIDFISCNGNILAGKAIDFSQEAKTIENHLFEFSIIVEGLRKFADRKQLAGAPQFYAYYTEPEDDRAGELFSKAKKDKDKHFTLKPVASMVETEETLESHSYRKFSEVVNS